MARSTFPSQNVQHTILGALLEVDTSKKGTALCREAHFQVKMLETLKKTKRTTMLGPLLDVQVSLGVAGLQGILHLPKSEQNVRVL